MLSLLVVTATLLQTEPQATATLEVTEQPAVKLLDLGSLTDAAVLPGLVWGNAPELEASRAQVASVYADYRKATFLPNPELDAAMNTIPVGRTTPANLQNRWSNVPAYTVGVSWLVEIGKRGLRQESTHAAARSAALDALEQLRQATFSLIEIIGDIATAEIRVATLAALADDAARLAALQHARAEKGDASELDADRADIEQQSTVAELSEARDQLNESLRICSTIVGLKCQAFRDADKAAAWLTQTFPATPDEITDRPDVRSLDSTALSAHAAQKLASRYWIPDPTFRVGYVYDNFIISGNQRNSFYAGFTIPLPVFNHGQADAQAAGIAARSAERARSKLIQTAVVQRDRIDTQRENVSGRLEEMRSRTIPMAKSIVDRLSAAVTRGAASLPELLLARRTYSELMLAANDLHRTFFRLQVERSRVTGAGLPFPKELNDVE